MAMIPGRMFRGGEDVYTDWFPRRGDSAIFRAQLIDSSEAANVELTVEVLTRNEEDGGDGASILPSAVTIEIPRSSYGPGSIVSVLVPAADTDSNPTHGLMEQIRFKVSTHAAGWIRAAILPVLQFDSAQT